MASLTDIIVAGVVGIVGSLIAAEIVAYSPRISRWLIARAVSKLSEADKARYSEEWLAHANEMPGSMARLKHALACWLQAARSIRQFRNRPMWQRRIEASYLRVYSWIKLRRMVLKLRPLVRKGGMMTAIRLLRIVNFLIGLIIDEHVYGDRRGGRASAVADVALKNFDEMIHRFPATAEQNQSVREIANSFMRDADTSLRKRVAELLNNPPEEE